MGSLLLVSLTLTVGVDAPLAELAEADLVARARTEIADGLGAQADESQARPHFQRAVLYYDELQRRNISNAALYLNLGNAHFLAGDIPQAILAYRRGLRLRPGDEDLRAALAAARERVYVPAESTLGRPPTEKPPGWYQAYLPAVLIVLSTTLYMLACLAMTRWWMMRSRWILCAAILFFLSAIATTSLVWHRANRLAEERAHPLIVIRGAQVNLLQGNGPDYPPRYPTPARPGVEGRLLFERDGWMQIELASGEIGWVAADQVLVDRE